LYYTLTLVVRLSS